VKIHDKGLFLLRPFQYELDIRQPILHPCVVLGVPSHFFKGSYPCLSLPFYSCLAFHLVPDLLNKLGVLSLLARKRLDRDLVGLVIPNLTANNHRAGLGKGGQRFGSLDLSVPVPTVKDM
jgi:hypothetical protein